ncbi:MAG: hypothetical protein R2825_26375 [Saprospiraceae bacterium]
MQKGNFLLILFIVVFMACKNDPPSAAATDDTKEELKPLVNEPVKTPLSTDRIAELQANAFDENDYVGRVKHSIELIQKQFIMSNKFNTPKGQQTITVDEDYNLLMRSEKDGQVQETKVNLRNLDQRNGGMRLIADVEKGDLPGFGIKVIPGKSGVELFTNGKKTGEENELQIFMADRSLIEQAVPAFLQALNIVHGRTS